MQSGRTKEVLGQNCRRSHKIDGKRDAKRLLKRVERRANRRVLRSAIPPLPQSLEFEKD